MRYLRGLLLFLTVAIITSCSGSSTTGDGKAPAKKEPETKIVDGKEILPEPREKH
jgi:hypothetical protein